MALQPNGKIVAVAAGGQGFLVARFNDDGSADTGFGDNGVATTGFGGTSASATSVALLADGKIVVGGNTVTEDGSGTNSDFALARFNSDGSLDTSFGGDGKVTAGLGNDEDRAFDMVVQSDGKIVLAGSEYVPGDPGNPDDFGGRHVALARFNPDGSPDAEFGSGSGYVVTGFAGTAYGIAQQSDGKLVLAARVDEDLAVVRLNEDGTIDNGFAGGTGVAKVEASQTGSQADSVVIRPNGKIVAGGWGYGVVLAQFDSDGTLDPGFSEDGVVKTGFPGYDLGSAIVLALQTDGKIVFAGQAGDHFGANEDFAIGRFDSSGAYDPTFGNGEGWITIDVGGGTRENYANTLLIQPDGKLLVGGSTGEPEPKLGIVRYEEGGVPVPARYLLSVGFGGAGRGSISSDVSGIQCGFSCSHVYSEGTEVTLTATPEAGFVFKGWSGGGCAGGGTCQVTMNATKDVVAEFGRTHEPASPLSWSDAVATDPEGEYASISCPSDSLCVAVSRKGHVLTSTNPSDGAGAWSVTANLGEYLRTVECPTASFCVAAGYNDVFTSTNPTGGIGSWQRSAIGTYYSIENISCPSASLCMASAGNEILTSTDPSGGFVAWSSRFITGPGVWIEGLSCASASLCAAVDGLGNVLTSTNPTGGPSAWHVTLTGTGNDLDSVSCPSQSLCIAMGEDGKGDDGFRTSTSPTVSGSWSDYTYLPGYYFPTAMTCASSTLCVAGNWNGEVFASTDPAAGNSSWTAPRKADADYAEVMELSCASNAFCAGVDEGGAVIVGTSSAVPQRSLSVQLSGDGAVTSSPAGIDCEPSCSHAFDEGTSVVLTATSAGGSTFAGWSGGGCSGTGPCVVNLTADTTVGAEFAGEEQAGDEGGDGPAGNASGGGPALGSTPPAAASPIAPAAAAKPRASAAKKVAAARRQALKKCRAMDGDARKRCVKKAHQIGRGKKPKPKGS